MLPLNMFGYARGATHPSPRALSPAVAPGHGSQAHAVSTAAIGKTN